MSALHLHVVAFTSASAARRARQTHDSATLVVPPALARQSLSYLAPTGTVAGRHDINTQELPTLQPGCNALAAHAIRPLQEARRRAKTDAGLKLAHQNGWLARVAVPARGSNGPSS
ncbi:hypothetical protein J1614_006028 [Plenodomus biglobosus]|nr:hypothetical protein J1614_006028 [Plenodomus biglobosus]